MELNIGEVVIITGIVIFFARIMWGIERLLNMHMNAESYGFGTERTNELLRDYLVETEASKREFGHVIKSLDETIARFADFFERYIELQTGMPVPPPKPPKTKR